MIKNKKLIPVIIVVVLLIFAYSCDSRRKMSRELINSSSRGDLVKVKALLNDGADATYVREEDGMTALLKAAARGHSQIANLLIENGADVDARDRSGSTPLLNAALGYPDTVRVLIQGGADINARDNTGGTALLRAVYRNQRDIVKILIEFGADVKIEDNSGDSALDLALSRGYKEIVDMLKKAGAKETE